MNDLLAGFAPITLHELDARGATLLKRVDHKYIVERASLDDLAAALRDDFDVLEIDGRRVFNYETVYFDCPDLSAYRAHVQGRRRRFKVRSRRYVESGRHVFEVKLKGRRGFTLKRQLPIDPGDHATLTADAERFADRVLREAYGHGLPEDMQPALTMTYQRVTLAARDGSERVTFDFGLDYGDAALSGAHAIVETKTCGGRGRADRALLELGVRPISVSKYCTGIGLTRDEVRANPWARLMRRYFRRSPSAAAAAR